MHQLILDFWFKELEPASWWKKEDAIDQLINERFSQIHRRATRCELFEWRTTPAGRLAEIIVLDQFSRNMFRNSPMAFAQDSQALALAQEAVAAGADKQLTQVERNFLYMPYMHSESLLIHTQAVKLFTENGLEESLDFELRHKVIIEKFGRYPHRNKILERVSTPEEIIFLQQPDSAF